MRLTPKSPWTRHALLTGAAVGLAATVVSIAAQQLFIIDFKKDDVGVVQNLAGASDVTLSPDGRFLLATGRRDDAVTSFAREMYFGSTTFDQEFVDDSGGVFNLAAPSAIAASADGRHVYVTGAFDNSLSVFGYDASNDGWQFIPSDSQEHNVGGVFGLENPTDVAVDPLSETVFVTASSSHSLAIFERDASTDDLVFVTAKENGVAASNLQGASAVAVSPDNRHVYVASQISDSVTAFHNAAGFAQIGSWIDGSGGIDGLNGASGVAVSPDGAHVYATGFNDNAVAIFGRDGATGALSFIGYVKDGQLGADGLAGASDVALNPAGDRLFVAGALDNAVALFRRSPVTGLLVFLEHKKPPVGLRGASALTASPDGLFVYAACATDNAVTGLYVALCQGDELTGDTDGDAVCNDIDQCSGDDFRGDSDLDTVCDDIDLCPGFDDAVESDGDGVPDGCDVCQGDDASGDDDSDQVCNNLDICAAGDDNADADADTVPDACDACFGDNASGDDDGDLVCNNVDQCQGNDATGDSDGDLVCNDLDQCQGDDATGDDDGDLVCNNVDLCEGDDATGDADGDLVCGDLDCDPANPEASAVDLCGVCGGDNGSCGIFFDGFESGDLSSWR